MRIIVSGIEYNVNFYHSPPIKGPLTRKAPKRFTRATISWIEADGVSLSVGKGIATCSHLDNFSKAEGRAIALSRAYENSNLPVAVQRGILMLLQVRGVHLNNLLM